MGDDDLAASGTGGVVNASGLPIDTRRERKPVQVVDVAGGKGELSFELENLHDVACVVVDPRAPMLDDVSQRFRRFRARGFLDNGGEAVSEGFRRRWRSHDEGGVELALRRPRHLRRRHLQLRYRRKPTLLVGAENRKTENENYQLLPLPYHSEKEPKKW